MSNSMKITISEIRKIVRRVISEGYIQDIMKMTPVQFYELVEFLESDIEEIKPRELKEYQKETGFDMGALLDLYRSYGSKFHQNTEIQKIKDVYTDTRKTTWGNVERDYESSFFE